MPPVDRLVLPPGMTLDQLLTEWPDEPLPNVAGFDRLYQSDDQGIQWLSEQLESQQVIDIVIKHHGDAGLARVLKGVAQACSTKKIHMSPRIVSIANYYGMTVY